VKKFSLSPVVMASLAILVALPAFAANSLDVNANAAMEGSFGLEVISDGTATNAFVQDDTPDSESIYRISFMFDPNSMSMTVGGRHFIAAVTADSSQGNKSCVELLLRRTASGYDIRMFTAPTAATSGRKKTPPQPLSDGPHTIEIQWQTSSGPGIEDGLIQMRIDGGAWVGRSDIRSWTQAVKNAKLGFLASSVDPTTIGSHYYDDFQSFRTLAP
jgi:hypothetical protein